MQITVWVKPNCAQCEQTKRQFDKRGINYQVKRLDKSPKAVERFLALGLLAAPIVETDAKRWSGFRLEKIKSLDSHLKNERRAGINKPVVPMRQVADEVSDE